MKELCFAVLADNAYKVEEIMQAAESNAVGSPRLIMGFRNMRERGATVFYYALKHNNCELLRALLTTSNTNSSSESCCILNEFVRDEIDVGFV
jgi:hypothetical protein